MGGKEGEGEPQTPQQARMTPGGPLASILGGAEAGGRAGGAGARGKAGKNARRRGQRGHLSFLSKTIRAGDASQMEEQI